MKFSIKKIRIKTHLKLPYQQVQKEAIKLKTLPILIDYLKHSTDGTVLRFVLNIIAAFLDHGEEVRFFVINL